MDRICTRCIMDSNVPGMAFDENGECVYCRIHDALDRSYPTGEEGKRKLLEIFEKIKADGAGSTYDCVVGTSGGTDSTYLLYLTKKMGLRPLAVHLDNGWNSEIAEANIRKSVAKLNIDLKTYSIDNEEMVDLCLAFLKASLPWPDIPADIAITSSLYRMAQREKIKYIIVGNNFRTEGKQPTEWTYGDGRLVSAVHKKFGKKKLSTFPNLTMMDIINNGFIKRMKLVRPIYYLDYNKEDVKRLLKKELDWEYYGGHHYESLYTHFLLSYVLPRKFGIDKRKVTLSAEVRSGFLSRDEALKRISEAPLSEEDANTNIDFVCKNLNITRGEFDSLMALQAKNFTDYPSYYPLINNFTKTVKFLVKYLLPWTPMIFYEMEEREKLK